MINQIEPDDLLDYFISCSQMQEIERKNSYLNVGLTEFQHKAKIVDYKNKFLKEGSEFLGLKLTIENNVNDISEKRIKISFSKNVPYYYYGTSEYGASYRHDYSESLKFIYLYSFEKFGQALLDFSRNEYVSITGEIIWIHHREGHINFGNTTDPVFNRSYDNDDGRFLVYLNLISIEKKNTTSIYRRMLHCDSNLW